MPARPPEMNDDSPKKAIGCPVGAPWSNWYLLSLYRLKLPECRYEYMSPQATDLFGYEPAEFYTSPLLIRKIIHPDFLKYFISHWRSLLKGEAPEYYEIKIIKRNGEQLVDPYKEQPKKKRSHFFFGFFLSIGLMIFYTTYFVGKYGATPGKMICKLKIIRPDGTELTYMRAFGRFFGEWLSSMILYIGYIMVGFDKEKRALHDMICDTRVIKQ